MPSMRESKALGVRIREIRERAGLNKQEFARVLRISPGYVTYLEQGMKAGQPVNPTETLLVNITHKFGVSLQWLKEGGVEMRTTIRERLIGELWTLNDAELEAVQKAISDAKRRGNADPSSQVGPERVVNFHPSPASLKN